MGRRAAIGRGAVLTLTALAGLLCVSVAGAQDSTDRASAPPAVPAAQQAQSLAPRTVAGRVVRPGRSGMVTVPRAWVTLHRVAQDSSGPVDSVRSDASGRYSIRYKPVGGDAVYFASSMYGGVAYFTAPLPPTDATGDAGEITVFDTTSAAIPVQTRGRHLVVSTSGVDGRRTLVEVFELSNDTTVTVVPGARGRATWSTALPPNAAEFQVGQSDIGSNAVQLRDGRVLAYASISPGVRQVAFSYSVPASDFPLTIPVAEPVGVFEVLVEDAGASVEGAGLAEQPVVTLEGRRFRRFLGQDVHQGGEITIDVGAPTTPRGNRFLLWPVVAAATIMCLALAVALTRRRPVATAPHDDTPPDAAHLARDIAELDEAFARTASPSDAQRASYQARRDALKAQLTAVLANEEVAV